MIIKVTQADIDISIPRNCEFCVIATALKEATGIKWEVMADNYGYSAYAYAIRTVNLPIRACAAIDAFDKGLLVEPFEFEFDFNPAFS